MGLQVDKSSTQMTLGMSMLNIYIYNSPLHSEKTQNDHLSYPNVLN